MRCDRAIALFSFTPAVGWGKLCARGWSDRKGALNIGTLRARGDNQPDLWQLPLELWYLVQEHSNVGLALSKREYAPVQAVLPTRSTIGILALLGNSTDINIERDLELLQQHLLPDAELYAPKQVERWHQAVSSSIGNLQESCG